MTDSVEASGQTVDEAIENALEELGATDDEVEIQILSEGDEGDPLVRTGLARVRVRFRDERSDEDFALEREEVAREQHERRRVDPEVATTQAASAQRFLEGLFPLIGVEASVQARPTAVGADISVSGSDLALLIGKHGATLAALRELCIAVAQKEAESRATISLDIAGYVQRRTEMLERMARSAASRVRRSRRPISLEPMPARERKVIHDALTDYRGVRTASEGEDPHRYVVISPE
ncbi:MAG: RNA-binding cell elongation regulator Jag/EloR [Actinomycetota bacterium]